MCDNLPSFVSIKIVVARKPHWCVECRRERIRPGDRYERASGIWDGAPDRYKTCMRCVNTRDAMMRESSEGCFTYGKVRENLQHRSADKRRHKEWQKQRMLAAETGDQAQ